MIVIIMINPKAWIAYTATWPSLKLINKQKSDDLPQFGNGVVWGPNRTWPIRIILLAVRRTITFSV